MRATTTPRTTGSAYIDGVLGDYKWAGTTLTYSFPTSAGYFGAGYGYGEPGTGFAPFKAEQRAAARAVLDDYAAVAKLRFVEVAETSANEAALHFGQSDRFNTAWAYFPMSRTEGGDIWVNRASGHYREPDRGNYAYATLVHEIGHALGLEHPHEGRPMPRSRNSVEYTAMSYRSYIGAEDTGGYTNERWGFAQTPMMYDIAALQHVYGANYDANRGRTVYSWSPRTGEMFVNGEGQGTPGTNRVFQTVWDGGGEDSYDFSRYATGLKVDLRPGNWTTTSPDQLAWLHYDGSEVAAGNIANALLHRGDLRSIIENAIGGAGGDTISGNSVANDLFGRGGDDLLRGGSGADRLDGGSGTDTASYSQAGATDARSGRGIVADLGSPRANTGQADGDSYHSIEALTGSRFRDDLRGDDGANTLKGNAGGDKLQGRGRNDRLEGGSGGDRLCGGSGADRLEGGTGMDVFTFEWAGHSPLGAGDAILDFARGDSIDLRGIDANTGRKGDQAFCYLGRKDLTGKAGDLGIWKGFVRGDVDGDGRPDFEIKVTDASDLDLDAFLL